jgi:hypothetical protein
MQPLGGNNAQALEERAQIGQRDVRGCCRDISLQPKKKNPMEPTIHYQTECNKTYVYATSDIITNPYTGDAKQ